MKPAHIELFIDRLCGLFPTTNIARNTLKSTWGKDDLLLDASEEEAKTVLKMCEGLDRFPGSLGEVKRMFRKVMGVVGNNAQIGCPKCDYTGYDNGRQEHPPSDEYPDGHETFYTEEYNGHQYTYIKPCECRGPQ